MRVSFHKEILEKGGIHIHYEKIHTKDVSFNNNSNICIRKSCLLTMQKPRSGTPGFFCIHNIMKFILKQQLHLL